MNPLNYMRLHDHPMGNPHHDWINVSNGKIRIDLSEYFEPSDFKRVVFPNLRPTNRLISIRLPDDLIDEVK